MKTIKIKDYTFKTISRARKQLVDEGTKFSGCPYKSIVPGIKGRAGENIYHECGYCIYCLVKKQSKLEFYAKKELFEEYKKGHGASFVTLTYSDEYEPRSVKEGFLTDKESKKFLDDENEIIDGIPKKIKYPYVVTRIKNIKDDLKAIKVMKEGKITLYKKDFQDFMKRFRRSMNYYKFDRKFKIIYCGEYGGKTGRSHWHFIAIGLSQSECITFCKKNWKYGIIDVGSLAAGGLRYIIDYVSKSAMKKKNKKELKQEGIQPPVLYHSIEMGKEWLIKNMDKLIENNFMYPGAKGKQTMLPINAIKQICKWRDMDYKEFFEKLANANNNAIKEKAKAKGLTEDQYRFEERIIKEMNNYQAIRSRGEVPIETDYLNKIREIETWRKPRTNRIYKNSNVTKLTIEALKSDSEIEKENFLKAMDFFETMELIENCKKSARTA